MNTTFRTDNSIPDAALLQHPAHCLSLGFGSGLSPYAPGTAGTLAAIPIYIGMSFLPITLYLFLLLVSFLLGVYVCGLTTRALGAEDHRAIVWDEFVGYWITMCLIPFAWYWVIIGFFMFRFFDVIKPWPANWLDRKIKGGMGIMLDDVVAGIYAFICMHVVNYIFQHYLQGS